MDFRSTHNDSTTLGQYRFLHTKAQGPRLQRWTELPLSDECVLKRNFRAADGMTMVNFVPSVSLLVNVHSIGGSVSISSLYTVVYWSADINL